MAMPRSATIGWIVAALIALGGVGVSVWAAQERTAVEERLASVGRELDERQAEVKRVRKAAERKEAETEGLAEALQACVDSIDEHLREFAPFDKELRRAGPGSLPELMKRLKELIEQAEAELPCEITATETV
jgi:predicted nuclease with TOPRIM domain